MGDYAFNTMRKSQRTQSPPPNGLASLTTAAKPNRRRTGTKTSLVIERPSTRFDDIGGMDATLLQICRQLYHVRHPEVYRRLGVTPARGLLLHGPPGSGKTLLANAIGGELALPFLKVNAPEVVSSLSGESESRLRDLFEAAASQAPSILFIDEIDAITPKRDEASKDMERRIVSQLISCIDALAESVLVIGATNRPDSLDPALRRAGRFDSEIGCGIPSEPNRRAILAVLSRSLRLAECVRLDEVAHLTPGYVGADLQALVREAAAQAVNRLLGSTSTIFKSDDLTEAKRALSNEVADAERISDDRLDAMFIEMRDFKGAARLVQPSSKREGFVTVPDVTWADVGALGAIRKELEMAIVWPTRHRDLFDKLGLASPPGILLCGPPGSGKTLLAKAVANESAINFISVKGPELLNMYVGESERAVRQVFERARCSAPCVVFFDEMDALCPRRAANDSNATSRVVNQLLTEMDGLVERRQVFVLGATNRPDILDPALLRPGRFDKTLYVGFPNAAERADILTALTKERKRPPLGDEVDLREIGVQTIGFTGADLAALVREASMIALREMLGGESSDKSAGSDQLYRVETTNFQQALQRVQPSITAKERQRYEKMRERFHASDSDSTKQQGDTL